MKRMKRMVVSGSHIKSGLAEIYVYRFSIQKRACFYDFGLIFFWFVFAIFFLIVDLLIFRNLAIKMSHKFWRNGTVFQER